MDNMFKYNIFSGLDFRQNWYFCILYVVLKVGFLQCRNILVISGCQLSELQNDFGIVRSVQFCFNLMLLGVEILENNLDIEKVPPQLQVLIFHSGDSKYIGRTTESSEWVQFVLVSISLTHTRSSWKEDNNLFISITFFVLLFLNIQFQYFFFQVYSLNVEYQCICF
eukprot:TRINITY_DN1139_c0_g3_i1.p2 TRINITY_DN1139_c0_g3~~TRINITY_DN1139_c0_g3_i1.p2  ORF type:complete len:167 (-),score=4.74 TRINITY_DN1139_c0_g3_i1:56-556(-)